MKAFALSVNVDQTTKNIARTVIFHAQNRRDVKPKKRSRCQIPAVQTAVCVNQAFCVFAFIVFLN